MLPQIFRPASPVFQLMLPTEAQRALEGLVEGGDASRAPTVREGDIYELGVAAQGLAEAATLLAGKYHWGSDPRSLPGARQAGRATA